jgi:hypothetical protein
LCRYVTGEGGADELHVLIRGEGAAVVEGGGGAGATATRKGEQDEGDLEDAPPSDVFSPHTLRSVCELKREIETSPGFHRVCRTKAGGEAAQILLAQQQGAGSDVDVSGGGEGVRADHCAPAWSIFDIHAVYETVGLGDVLRRLVDIGRMNTNASSSGFLSDGGGVSTSGSGGEGAEGAGGGGAGGGGGGEGGGSLAEARRLCRCRQQVTVNAPTVAPRWTEGEEGDANYNSASPPPPPTGAVGAELCTLAGLGCSPEVGLYKTNPVVDPP